MKNTYYIHDAGSGRLIIGKWPRMRRDADPEEAIMSLAEAEGMHWGDCSCGGVSSISINI